MSFRLKEKSHPSSETCLLKILTHWLPGCRCAGHVWPAIHTHLILYLTPSRMKALHLPSNRNPGTRHRHPHPSSSLFTAISKAGLQPCKSPCAPAYKLCHWEQTIDILITHLEGFRSSVFILVPVAGMEMTQEMLDWPTWKTYLDFSSQHLVT